MSRVRKICIVLISALYLFGVFPPFMSVYNRPGFVLGIPNFIFGLIFFALAMLGVTYFLYRYENKHSDDSE